MKKYHFITLLFVGLFIISCASNSGIERKTYGEKENKKVHFKEIPNFYYFKFYHVFYVMLCCILQKRQYKKSNYKINSE